MIKFQEVKGSKKIKDGLYVVQYHSKEEGFNNYPYEFAWHKNGKWYWKFDYANHYEVKDKISHFAVLPER
ncbi:MAG: hypothetical protein KDD03_00210 [Gelidibacter sp.]|nr:hypothetical protein [Gelidibacter sp.]